MNIKLFIQTICLSLLAVTAAAQKKVTIYRSGTALSPSYSTLDSAFKRALNGDSIVLSPHTFYEYNLSLSSVRNIILQGTLSGGDTTTIDAAGSGGILEMRSPARVRNIIFQNSKGMALAFYLNLPWDTCFVSGHCIFRNNNGNGAPAILGYPFSSCITLEDDVLFEYNTNAEYTIHSEYQLHIKDRVQIRHNQSRIATIKNNAQGFRIEGQVRIQYNSTDTGLTGGIIMGEGIPDSSISMIGDEVVISDNSVRTAGRGMGGAICILRKLSSYPKRLEIGAALISNNTAARGGAIYCDRPDYTIRTNGTRFYGNNAQLGGGAYIKSSLDMRQTDFRNNKADTGAALYLTPEVSGSVSPVLSVTRCRIYDFTAPGKRPNEVFATYTPATALPPELSVNGNWWGKSDVLNAFRCSPPFSALNNWAVADWQINEGVPPVAGDTAFPVGAVMRTYAGGPFPAASFSMLEGHFSADTGTFSAATVPINSDNKISSRYRTYPDGTLTSTDCHFLAYIDEDTFRTTVVVWSRDTSIAPVAVREAAPTQPLLVYPNPATDLLHISHLPAGCLLTLYDQAGRQVWQQPASATTEHCNVSGLAPGTYLLQVRTGSGYQGSVQVHKR